MQALSPVLLINSVLLGLLTNRSVILIHTQGCATHVQPASGAQACLSVLNVQLAMYAVAAPIRNILQSQRRIMGINVQLVITVLLEVGRKLPVLLAPTTHLSKETPSLLV